MTEVITMNDYNYCSNRTNKDPTADRALNKGRLSYCQRVINLLINFLGRRKYKLLNIEIWDTQKKKIYKGKDFDL